MPSDEEVVRTAAEAAEGYVFSRLSKSDVEDLDITVSFEDGVLDVEVYVTAPDADEDLAEIADDAALVAGEAVDDLFED